VSLDPRQAEPYFQIGSILANEREACDQAVHYLVEGLKISPEDSVAHSLLAVLYRQDRRYADSIAGSRKAVALSPVNPALHVVLGRTLFDNHRQEEAIAELREAIHLRPSYAVAYYYLALSQEEVKDTRTAQQSWQFFFATSAKRSRDA
jgi:predicted Zn-dependent protease